MTATVSSIDLPATGEVAVIGLGRSGVAAVTLLRRYQRAVYASDATASETTRMNAAALEALGATLEIGGHDIDRIAKASLVVASPGVPPNAAALVAARAAHVEVISEVELALRCMPSMAYVAITGTNGKTTTTALTSRLLKALGHLAVGAGNIGTPLTEVALRKPIPEWIALEISSFQLHDTPSLRPRVGVLTNLAPDHLDRYATAEEYYADKARLFANATSESTWVLNADDVRVTEMAKGMAGEHFYFSVSPSFADEAQDRNGDVAAYYDHDTGMLVAFGEPLIARSELQLLGNHNIANVLAATLAVMAAAPEHRTAEAREKIARQLREFRPLSHRLELVGEWRGVQWINDSKATNVSSAYVAIAGMTRPTILLLGGRHKGEPYTTLIEPVRANVRRVIAYGEASQRIAEDLAGVVPVDRMRDDFGAVIAHARAIAQPGDAVLLSPACSSFDMFKHYEERGERFRALAPGLA